MKDTSSLNRNTKTFIDANAAITNHYNNIVESKTTLYLFGVLNTAQLPRRSAAAKVSRRNMLTAINEMPDCSSF